MLLVIVVAERCTTQLVIDFKQRKAVVAQKTAQVVEKSTEFDNGQLVTIKHDGHLFILWVGNQKGGILHHPSCTCRGLSNY